MLDNSMRGSENTKADASENSPIIANKDEANQSKSTIHLDLDVQNINLDNKSDMTQEIGDIKDIQDPEIQNKTIDTIDIDIESVIGQVGNKVYAESIHNNSRFELNNSRALSRHGVNSKLELGDLNEKDDSIQFDESELVREESPNQIVDEQKMLTLEQTLEWAKIINFFDLQEVGKIANSVIDQIITDKTLSKQDFGRMVQTQLDEKGNVKKR